MKELIEDIIKEFRYDEPKTSKAIKSALDFAEKDSVRALVKYIASKGLDEEVAALLVVGLVRGL